MLGNSTLLFQPWKNRRNGGETNTRMIFRNVSTSSPGGITEPIMMWDWGGGERPTGHLQFLESHNILELVWKVCGSKLWKGNLLIWGNCRPSCKAAYLRFVCFSRVEWMSQGRSFYSKKLSFHSYIFQTWNTKCSTLQSLPAELRVFIRDLPENEVNFCPLMGGMGVHVQNIFTTSTSILNKSDAWRTRLNSGMLLRKRKFLQKVWLTIFCAAVESI